MTPSRQPDSSRDPSRRPLAPKADIGNEELRARINTLQYELDTVSQKGEMVALHHDTELRALQAKVETEQKRAQAAENASHVITKRAASLAEELQTARDSMTAAMQSHDRSQRDRDGQLRLAREEADEARSQLQTERRATGHHVGELESRRSAAEQALADAQLGRDQLAANLQRASERLAQQDVVHSELQAELTTLRAQAGELDSVQLVRRELAEQVALIKRLESANRDQTAELRLLRSQRQSVDLVQEEKRALESKLARTEDVHRQLAEAQLQRQLLEDERRSWAAYLETAPGQSEGLTFKTPEAMARAFMQERLERAGLLDKIGQLQPELTVKDDNIRQLEEENGKITAELNRLRSPALPSAMSANPASGQDAKSKARLERQRALALKEVDFLRVQLAAADAEEVEFHPDRVDGIKERRIEELVKLLDEHRHELESLRQELERREADDGKQSTAAGQVQSSSGVQRPATSGRNGRKRSHDLVDDDATDQHHPSPDKSSDRIGELSRRNRRLQDELSDAQTRASVLEAELTVMRAQISSLQSSSRTRILELRSNPSAEAASIKQATLDTLREENRELLRQLEAGSDNKGDNEDRKRQQQENVGAREDGLVPTACLASVRDELSAAHRKMAAHEKRTKRLKEQWAALASEFRIVAATLLGWRLEFLDAKRVRVSSVFRPGRTKRHGEGSGDTGSGEDTEENSILFDSRNGTMKVSGGRESVFANEIKELTDEWVDRRNVIPCFLAALTIDLYEKSEVERASEVQTDEKMAVPIR